MSEIVRRSITDLETRISEFDEETRSEQEVAEFKKSSNKELQRISQNLIGLLTELREGLSPDKRKKESLHFSGYGLKFRLTYFGVRDSRAPHECRPTGYIANGLMYPDLKKYLNERHPSPNGAKLLLEQITEIEKNNGHELEGKYLANNYTK